MQLSIFIMECQVNRYYHPGGLLDYQNKKKTLHSSSLQRIVVKNLQQLKSTDHSQHRVYIKRFLERYKLSLSRKLHL